MEAFCQEEHLMLGDPTTFTPDYQSKIRISIENIPIELPHTKIRTLSKYATLVTYFITGTRVTHVPLSKNTFKSISTHLEDT